MNIHTVAVLGGGSMGTALASVAAQNGAVVRIWSIEPPVVESINTAHHNHAYLPDVQLPESITATGVFEEAVTGAGLIISALPTQTIAEVYIQNAIHFAHNALVLTVSKGFSNVTGETPSQIIRSVLPSARCVALMGPLFAREIAGGMQSVGLLASEDASARADARGVLCNEIFHARESADARGAECCGALKNIYAILIGAAAELGYGWNTQSALLTMALEEIAPLVEHLGGKRETAYGLAGVGDLITTGFGQDSRNRRFGQALCNAASVDSALASVGQVVEGVKTLGMIDSLLHEYHAPLPLLSLARRIVQEGCHPSSIIKEYIEHL